MVGPLGGRSILILRSAFRVSAIRSPILKRRSLNISTDFWGVACGRSMVLNFFSKKVHKKLPKRYIKK